MVSGVDCGKLYLVLASVLTNSEFLISLELSAVSVLEL